MLRRFAYLCGSLRGCEVALSKEKDARSKVDMNYRIAEQRIGTLEGRIASLIAEQASATKRHIEESEEQQRLDGRLPHLMGGSFYFPSCLQRLPGGLRRSVTTP